MLSKTAAQIVSCILTSIYKAALYFCTMVLTQQTLPVMEAFYTLQGEGFHQGKAAYFIRLGGCNGS